MNRCSGGADVAFGACGAQLSQKCCVCLCRMNLAAFGDEVSGIKVKTTSPREKRNKPALLLPKINNHKK